MPEAKLLDDALKIWQAGLDAVRPERLIPKAVRVDADRLLVQDCRGDAAVEVELRSVARIHVVGGGKAGAAMARGMLASLGADVMEAKRLGGLLSVPEDCVEPLDRIRLVGGRPPGVNEPTPAGEAATREMLSIVGEAGPDDLVICLISGGGSALLTAPTPPLTVEDKAIIARKLSAAGATIHELNTVRQQVSDIKGGGLVRACRAGRLLTLVVSDVPGDPLDLIASGPTVACQTTPDAALAVLTNYGLADDPALSRVIASLRAKPPEPQPIATRSDVVMLANNAAAVDAAGAEAERRGYRHAMTSATTAEGTAEEVGEHLAEMATSMRASTNPDTPNCLISGGEPTVELAPAAIRGRGGRNQQLVLAALRRLEESRGVALVSGGTDGEDGPTDAAGGYVTQDVAKRLGKAGVDLADTLHRNDAYPALKAAGALLMTGPTGTNVCDLRVLVVDR